MLTHIHPDHDGSALPLARFWDVPVYLHPDEMPMAGPDYPLEYTSPVDRRFTRWYQKLVRPLIPRSRQERLRAQADLRPVVRCLDSCTAPPGMPGWEPVHTPGHTPGHVAFFRRDDRVLITGDAVMTIDANSIIGVALGTPTLSGPPRWFSWSWPKVIDTVAGLAALEPQVLLPGHGEPLTGSGIGPTLRAFAGELRAGASAATLPTRRFPERFPRLPRKRTVKP
jgi:glyoxylase-like metal-dependent hydrolase (beta-lactamase superfamily II)